MPFERRRHTASVAVVLVTLLPSPTASQEPPDGPPVPSAERCQGEPYRQFDFWVGRWEVRNESGDLVGHNEITGVAGGCGLLERWTGQGGGSGVSVNTYDADLGRWTQRWVGDGATLWLEGGMDGDRMVLTGSGPRTTARGPVLDRIAWTPLADGRVHQMWEVSADGGSSWETVFSGFYARMEGDGDSLDNPAGRGYQALGVEPGAPVFVPAGAVPRAWPDRGSLGRHPPASRRSSALDGTRGREGNECGLFGRRQQSWGWGRNNTGLSGGHSAGSSSS